jgi:hypothetical protein
MISALIILGVLAYIIPLVYLHKAAPNAIELRREYGGYNYSNNKKNPDVYYGKRTMPDSDMGWAWIPVINLGWAGWLTFKMLSQDPEEEKIAHRLYALKKEERISGAQAYADRVTQAKIRALEAEVDRLRTG